MLTKTLTRLRTHRFILILAGSALLSACGTPRGGIQEVSPQAASRGAFAPAVDPSTTTEPPAIASPAVSIEALEAFLDAEMAAANIPGLSLAVINDGRVVYATGRGDAGPDQPVDDDTVFEAASLSKPMFAYLTLTAVDRGLLDLDRPLLDYLDYAYPGIDYDNPHHKLITARRVLSHTTGLPNWRPDFALEIAFEPGTDFSYSGEGYQLLAKALQSILQTDHRGLEDDFQQNVAGPLGLDRTRFVQDESNLKHKATPHRNGQPLPVNRSPAEEFGAAYAVHSNATEYARWLVAVMRGEGLSEANHAAMFTDQFVLPEGSPFEAYYVEAWTLGLGRHRFGDQAVYGHMGDNEGYTALFLIDPQRQWGMVVLTNADDVDDFTFELFRFLAQLS
ncbi:MAG: serine hydrolase domain-containing protein [Planctomycetota bacterium]